MTCSEFHDRFSDYYDGTGEPSFLGEADAHLSACARCRRFHEVVARGAEILKGAPQLSVADDFLPRLQHRIYHLEDGAALSGAEAGSAATVTTAVAIAALIALAAWSPALLRAPEVELSPIVVNRPEPRIVGVRPPQFWISASEPGIRAAVDRDLWDDPQLFLRYSPLTAPSVRQVTTVRSADLE